MSEPIKDLKPVGQKAPLYLLPLRPLGAVAGVMEHGATKYARWNWMNDTQAQARMEELVGAVMRHALAVFDPSQDEFDEESGIHHMAHVACGALIYLHKRGISYQPSLLIKKPEWASTSTLPLADIEVKLQSEEDAEGFRGG